MRYWNLSFDDIKRQVSRLGPQLPFYPDVIVAIARGGLIPASLIHRAFPKAEFQVLTAKSYTGIFKQSKVRIRPFDWKNLQGKNVLFIDDVYDTGQTWNAIVKKIPRNVSFVLGVLVNKQPRIPYIYSGECCSPDIWVLYPWEERNENK